MYSSSAMTIMSKYTNKKDKIIQKERKSKSAIKKQNLIAKEVIECSELGKQIFLGKKLNKNGLGQEDDDGTDFLAAAIHKKETTLYHGKFVKKSTKLNTIPIIDKLDEFKYLSGKGGVNKNSAKLKRMEALYAKDKEDYIK